MHAHTHIHIYILIHTCKGKASCEIKIEKLEADIESLRKYEYDSNLGRYLYIHNHIYMFIHTYAHSYIYSYIHTHIHTCTFPEANTANEKLRKELTEVQKELEMIINRKETDASLSSSSSSLLFTDEELQQIEAEKKNVDIEIPPVIPQVITTEIICSICREKQTTAKLEAEGNGSFDASQWDIFIPPEGERSSGKGGRTGSRKRRGSVDNKNSAGGSAPKENSGDAATDEKRPPSGPGNKRGPEVVNLLQPSESASNEELTLRDELLLGISSTMGPMQAKKAINGIHTHLEYIGNLLHIQKEAQWKW